MMNSGSALQTAFIRGVYTAVLSGLLVGLTAMQTGANDRDAIITGVISALVALGARGGVEGLYDKGRDDTGDVKQSDVSA